MGKNIVVFSDGTGKEGGQSPNSNVYKLFNMVEDRTQRQIAFYDQGLGTGWRKVTGAGAGMGISQNIIECYTFVFENFEAGDEVFLFGFSRGAFTVRSLGGFISLCGILPKSRAELIPRAYKIYKIVDPEERKAQMAEFLTKHHTMRCPIRFIGVWDTVAALGLPFKLLDQINPFRHEFHDATLNANIRNGFHALSIDDERRTFHPTFWNEHKISKGQTIRQVWFPGVHSDVGGGYPEQKLSDVPLTWMVKHAKAKGLRIYPNNRVGPTLEPQADGTMHGRG